MKQESDYNTRVAQEIQAYREVENIHDLPDIYHAWAAEFLLPRMQEVFGTGSNVLFYVNAIAEKCATRSEPVRVVSIGSGDGSLEVEIARELFHREVQNFHIECLELSSSLVARARFAIGEASVSAHVSSVETDINKWVPDSAGSVDVVIANQFLHHVVELEFLFDQIDQALKPDGTFMTTDVIGRNGHMRWPEAELILETVWRCLPDRYKYNHQLQRLDAQYVNWDCSVEGFEGIRCQDILPLLIRRFQFHTFLAYGNLTDIFIDRSYGHNFDPNDPADMAFIRHLARLNDVLIDLGVIKPTMLFASMSKLPSEMTTYRNWRPGFCVRNPTHERLQLNSESAELMQHQVAFWVAGFGSETTGLGEVISQLANLENRAKKCPRSKSGA